MKTDVSLLESVARDAAPWAWAWAWAGVALALVAFWLRGRTVARAGRSSTAEAPEVPPLATHAGMPPPPGRAARRTSLAEHIPTSLFYLPLAFRWFLLGLRYRSFLLPTIANPRIPLAGLWGESKSELMRQIAPEFRPLIARFTTVRRSAGEDLAPGEFDGALEAMRAAGLDFPLVAKPDSGWQGHGVQRIASAAALRAYLQAYPRGETVLLQMIAPWDGEAAVFYVRYPGCEHGRVESMTLRYFPFVVGDGASTVRQLIARDERASFKAKLHLRRNHRHLGTSDELLDRVPAAGETVRLSFIGSIRVGGLYYDAQALVTPALQERFDAICRSMPEFYFGRFDLRFRSVEHLQRADGFAIIEVNGAGSEAIHVWDPRKPVLEVYRDLLRFQAAMFQIGALNREQGWKPARLRDCLRVTGHYRSMLRRYPPSN